MTLPVSAHNSTGNKPQLVGGAQLPLNLIEHFQCEIGKRVSNDQTV